MNARLVGIVGTLWFFFALMMLFIAFVYSGVGFRLLLPEGHPATWIVPILLFGVPALLASQRFVSPKFSRPVFWMALIGLAVLGVGLFAFLSSIFVGH